MPSLKDKFESAHAYIQAEQYEDARRILKTIDHPKATELLAKLDAKSPPKPPFYRTNFFRVVIALIVFVVAGVGIWYNTSYKYDRAVTSLWWSCVEPALITDSDASHCDSYGHDVLAIASDNAELVIDECFIIGGDIWQEAIDYPYSLVRCLKDLGLLEEG